MPLQIAILRIILRLLILFVKMKFPPIFLREKNICSRISGRIEEKDLMSFMQKRIGV